MADTLLTEIEAFLDAHGMAESTFGREALGDWKLISELRGKNREKARRLWPDTEAKVRTFMVTYRPHQKADAA